MTQSSETNTNAASTAGKLIREAISLSERQRADVREFRRLGQVRRQQADPVAPDQKRRSEDFERMARDDRARMATTLEEVKKSWDDTRKILHEAKLSSLIPSQALSRGPAEQSKGSLQVLEQCAVVAAQARAHVWATVKDLNSARENRSRLLMFLFAAAVIALIILGSYMKKQ